MGNICPKIRKVFTYKNFRVFFIFILENFYIWKKCSTFAVSFERQVNFSLILKVVATLKIQQMFYENANY